AFFDLFQRSIHLLEPIDIASNQVALPLEGIESLRIVLEFNRPSVLLRINVRLLGLSVLSSFDETRTQANEGLALLFQEYGIQSRLRRWHERLQTISAR